MRTKGLTGVVWKSAPVKHTMTDPVGVIELELGDYQRSSHATHATSFGFEWQQLTLLHT